MVQGDLGWSQVGPQMMVMMVITRYGGFVQFVGKDGDVAITESPALRLGRITRSYGGNVHNRRRFLAQTADLETDLIRFIVCRRSWSRRRYLRQIGLARFGNQPLGKDPGKDNCGKIGAVASLPL